MTNKDYNYFDDSVALIGLSSDNIKPKMSNEEIVQSTLFFAIGMESLLKQILTNINPIYILDNSDFKHSVPTLYDHKLISKDNNSEIAPKPNKNVIAYRTSLSRAKLFSKATDKNSQLLYSLAQWRDIIVHRIIENELDYLKCQHMLQKDFVRVLQDFSDELNIKIDIFLKEKTETLIFLSESIIEKNNFEKEMQDLINYHFAIWERNSKDIDIIQKAENTTSYHLKSGGNYYSNEEIDCPVCGNSCVIRIEPDYDHSDGEGYVSGAYVESLKCYYCGLNIDDYQHLDYFDIEENLRQQHEDLLYN